MAKGQTRSSKTNLTIFRAFLNTKLQISHPNIVTQPTHLHILKLLLETFPDMQSKLKSVKKWRTGWGPKFSFKSHFTPFRTFFHTISQILQPNIVTQPTHLHILKLLLETFQDMQSKLKSVKKWRTGWGPNKPCKVIADCSIVNLSVETPTSCAQIITWWSYDYIKCNIT